MRKSIKQTEGPFYFFDQTIEQLKEQKTINDKIYLLENLIKYQKDLMQDVKDALIDGNELAGEIWFSWDYNELHQNLCQLIYLNKLFTSLNK